MLHFLNAAGQTVAKDPRGSWRIYNPTTAQFGAFAKAPAQFASAPAATPTPSAPVVNGKNVHWAVPVAAMFGVVVVALGAMNWDIDKARLTMTPPAVTAPDKAPPAVAEKPAPKHGDQGMSPFIATAPRGHKFVGATVGQDGSGCSARGGHIVPDTSKSMLWTGRGWARPNKCTAD